MKGFKITKPFEVLEQEITEQPSIVDVSKVKITKSLIALPDILSFSGENEAKNIILGGIGIGVVSETNANLFGLEKNQRVFINPNLPCNQCYNCKNGETDKCFDLKTAGEDYDGFLSDFAVVPSDRLFVLPDSVSDKSALFIGHISLAVSVIDELNIQKGDYVVVIGANNFGIILAQILMYYQAVPIVLDIDDENVKIAKESGIYYVLNRDDNWTKEVASITGGRMAKSAVYISDCDIPASKAFAVASFNANIALTGNSFTNNSISFAQAVKKQLDIHCIHHGSGNIPASINLIANNAVDLSKLKLNSTTYQDIPITLKQMAEQYKNSGKIYETIVDLI